MNYLKADKKLEVLKNEAEKAGFVVVETDFRIGYAHLKNGTEVRHCAVIKYTTEHSLRIAVKHAIQYGERLDKRTSSKYFSEEQQ